jgi:alpha-D-ribose 1-methylphosphonate 5-triphosphate diphosphatase
VVRGGSHTNRLRVRDAVAAGLCDVLVSDYFYPALLYAPFALTREGVLPLAEAWQLVSANAAHAAGLIDRGTIRPGARADLLVIEEDVAGLPRVSATVVAGAARFQAEWPTITAAA